MRSTSEILRRWTEQLPVKMTPAKTVSRQNGPRKVKTAPDLQAWEHWRLLLMQHCLQVSETCKNGWTDRDAVWGVDLWEPREPWEGVYCRTYWHMPSGRSTQDIREEAACVNAASCNHHCSNLLLLLTDSAHFNFSRGHFVWRPSRQGAGIDQSAIEWKIGSSLSGLDVDSGGHHNALIGLGGVVRKYSRKHRVGCRRLKQVVVNGDRQRRCCHSSGCHGVSCRGYGNFLQSIA